MSGKSNRWRRAGIIVAVIVGVVILATWLVLRSAGFQKYVVQKAETSASEVLGAPVHIQRFQLHLHSLTPSVDVYGLTIAGKPVAGVKSPQPLVSIPHAHVAVHVTSLLHRTVQIEDVELEHPRIHIYVDADGHTNLPTPPGQTKQQGQGPDIFALGIGKAAIHNGEVFVNDKEQNLNADLRGVELGVSYAPGTQSYSGRLSYDSGRVQVSDMPAITTGLNLRFVATRDGVRVPSLVLTAEGVRVNAQATLSDYKHPRLEASYQAQLDLSRLRAALHRPALPQGEAKVNGSAQYADGGLSAKGTFSSAALRMRLAELAAPIRNLRGTYEFADGALHIRQLQAAVMGGRLQASATLSHLAAAPRLQAAAQLQGAKLGQVAQYAPNGQHTLATLGITGTLGAAITAHAPHGLDSLNVSTKTNVEAKLGPTPVTAAAEVSYTGGQLTIHNSSVRTPHAQMRITGGLSTRAGAAARLEVHVRAGDLAEVEALANRVAAARGKPLPALGVSGSGTLDAQVAGTLAAPQISGRFDANPLAVRRTQWKSVDGSFAAGPSHAAVSQLKLTAARGSIAASGSLALDHWRPEAGSALKANVQVTGLPVEQVAPLVGSKLPVSGTVDARASVSGTLGAPVGQGTATLQPARLQVGGERAGLESARVEFHAVGGAVTAKLTAQLAAGAMQASGTWRPATGAYTAKLSAPALQVAKLPPVAAAKLGIHGSLAVAGHGEGKLSAPVFTVKLTSGKLSVDGQTVQDVEADVNLAAQHLEATLKATSLQTALSGKAAITLQGDWPATASLDAPAVPLAPVLAAFAPAAGGAVTGQTAVKLSLTGPVRKPGQLQVAITVPKFQMQYAKTLELHATAPVEAHLAHGVVQVSPAEFAGTGSDFKLQGSIPVPALGPAAAAAMNVTLAGNINLKLAEALVPGISSGGNVDVQLHAAGELAHPALTGVIQVSNASVSNPSWPLAVQSGQGALRLHDGRLDLTGFTATAGGGQLTVGGGMTLAPKVEFNFTVAADEVRTRFPEGLRETVAANVNFTGTPAAALLSGRVRIEEVSPAPGFDFATLTGQLARQTVAVAAPGSFLNNLRLEIAVSTPNQIHIVSRDFSIGANANLNVRGTAQEPVVLGRMDLTNGDLIFRGNRYVIQAGTLDFVNPIRTVPTVNVTADTSIQQYDLHLHFQGPMDNLRTSYTSDPALPPADIINLLAFGTTTEASAANPLPGNLGAENLVASAVTSQITDRVEKIAGISHLSVDPVLGGGQQNAGARITLQQRVTGNLYVTISTDVTSTQRNVIEIQYRMSPRVSVSGVRKQNGGFGANLQFKKVWH